jgi:drug/metabolite transporter (DMT)-like permease
MEKDLPATEPPARPSTAQAQEALRELASDRATLADRLAAPWWLYPFFALIAAGYVATPAIRSDEARNAVVGILIAAGVVLLVTYRRLSGVRVSRTGGRGAALLVGLLMVVLLLLSTSYGLVSLLSAWWVLVSATVCFGVVLVLGRWFDRVYRENLRHGH